MEEFDKSCRFILTANNLGKISDPIISRSQLYDFKPSDEKAMKLALYNRVTQIANTEKINASKGDLVNLVKACYPDIRKCINTLQRYTVDGNFKFTKVFSAVDEMKVQLVNYIALKKLTEIRKEIVGNLDYLVMYRTIFDNVDKLTTKNQDIMMLQVSEHLHRHKDSVDPEINFISCIIQVMKEVDA
jgi:DNA polymerase III delta prime subunit